MAKHQWSVLCRKGILDKNENTISLIETVEGLDLVGEISQETAESFPVTTSQAQLGFQLITLWVRSDRGKPEENIARVQIKGPNGKTLANQEYKITLKSAARSRHVMNFPRTPYIGPGIYRYITQLKGKSGSKAKWTKVSELELDLNIRNPDGQSGTGQ